MKVAEAELGSAEEEAKRLVSDAIKISETKKGDLQGLFMGQLPVQDGKEMGLGLFLGKAGDLLELLVLADLFLLRLLKALGGLLELFLECPCPGTR